jgi:hypothetical protein
MAISGTTITDISTGAAQAVGRYFSVISVLPSSLYVTFVYLLVASGSWTHQPNWQQAFSAIAHPGISGLAFLAFLSIGLGIVVHPIQFAIVQFLEGYWGTSRVALNIRAQRIMHYQRVCERLDEAQNSAGQAISDLTDAGAEVTPNFWARINSQYAEAMRVRDTNFPPMLDQVMPTRLGNMLRRAEVQAGSQYGMDALRSVPHLMMVAEEKHVSYVNDQRTLLDLAVRMTILSAAATGTAVLFLWPYGLWVLVALLPYMIAYASYRGAVMAARHYGSALNLLINLNRFRLYEELHLPLPATAKEERKLNQAITSLFAYNKYQQVDYMHPAVENDKSQVSGAKGGDGSG